MQQQSILSIFQRYKRQNQVHWKKAATMSVCPSLNHEEECLVISKFTEFTNLQPQRNEMYSCRKLAVVTVFFEVWLIFDVSNCPKEKWKSKNRPPKPYISMTFCKFVIILVIRIHEYGACISLGRNRWGTTFQWNISFLGPVHMKDAAPIQCFPFADIKHYVDQYICQLQTIPQWSLCKYSKTSKTWIFIRSEVFLKYGTSICTCFPLFSPCFLFILMLRAFLVNVSYNKFLKYVGETE